MEDSRMSLGYIFIAFGVLIICAGMVLLFLSIYSLWQMKKIIRLNDACIKSPIPEGYFLGEYRSNKISVALSIIIIILGISLTLYSFSIFPAI